MRTLLVCLYLAAASDVGLAGEPATPTPAVPPAQSTPPADAAAPAEGAKPADAGKPAAGEEEEESADLPPGEKGSADNNVSFPVDI